MTKLSPGTGFGTLFKKYRLRSEIETLSEFGDLLAQEGIVYETSLFTRWQNGDRVPKDRRVILTIIRLFIKLGGITSIEEVNTFLESLNQRDVSGEEKKEFGHLLHGDITFPDRPKIFFYSSPICHDFDNYTDVIYSEIEKNNCIHLCHETKLHHIRELILEVEKGIAIRIDEYKKTIIDTIETVKKADICIFETSSKTIGTGYLIHQSLDYAKPTVILYYRKNKPHIFSVMINKNLTLKSYNETNIKNVVKNVLNLVRK